ncbi:MAG: hypothetical protein IT305_15165 [Chloroflexi bacterium]|nr:hypothetical protein [Chloroflexota bacterium]
MFVGDFGALLGTLRPTVLVDARMRKRETPERQLGLAPLTIGLGPNFAAGETTDLVVETGYGPDLGHVIERGVSRPLGGEPRAIDGVARERYVYAPVAGIFRTSRAIGDLVAEGEPVAAIEPDAAIEPAVAIEPAAHLGAVSAQALQRSADPDTGGRGGRSSAFATHHDHGCPSDGQIITLTAPIAGALRGVTRSGVPVAVRTKVIEVDPRGRAGQIWGIGERPGAIAAGVVAAIRVRFPGLDVAAC